MQPQQDDRRSGGFKLSPRIIIIGLVVLGILFFLTRNNQRADTQDTRVPVAQDGGAAQSVGGAELGRIYSALSLDRDGCPADITDQFVSSDAIYIATDESYIPRDTALFVRLYLEDRAVEDTDEIIAPEDLTACVNFVFENQRGFEPGNYEAEVYVNGTPVSSVAFSVR